MKVSQFTFSFVSALLLSGALAQAATVTGTVTNKTTNKPAPGDTVVLVDVQAGMGEVAKATTDSKGHYSINEPGNGPYLVRVTHQGGTYFIAAPEGGRPGDIPVYDVAAKVDGVSVEADVLEVEADGGQLKVNERYYVRNTSSPPRTEYNPGHGFEVVLPSGISLDGTSGRRPTGLPTSIQLTPKGAKDHYQFDFPIQPNEGENETLFQITYHVPYNGKYSFQQQLAVPVDNVAVLLPKSMSFTAGSGAAFQSVPQDPSIQTYLLKNALPGKALEFTISGTGSMPRENQGNQAGAQSGADNGAQGAAGNTPGGGIGEPIGTPDPLSKYKWWILGGLGLLLAAAAAFLLRRPVTVPGTPGEAPAVPIPIGIPAPPVPVAPSSATTGGGLLAALKEELFTLESEKISGIISPEEYAVQKTALETVLKRALKR